MACRDIVRGIERVSASTISPTVDGTEPAWTRGSLARADTHAPKPSAEIAAPEVERNSRRESILPSPKKPAQVITVYYCSPIIHMGMDMHKAAGQPSPPALEELDHVSINSDSPVRGMH
jgi:hypothetical protein